MKKTRIIALAMALMLVFMTSASATVWWADGRVHWSAYDHAGAGISVNVDGTPRGMNPDGAPGQAPCDVGPGTHSWTVKDNSTKEILDEGTFDIPGGTATEAPATEQPTTAPATEAPTAVPATEAPTAAPATDAPATQAPATAAPATAEPSKTVEPGNKHDPEHDGHAAHIFSDDGFHYVPTADAAKYIVKQVKEATCTTAAYTEYACEICGAHFTKVDVPAFGHGNGLKPDIHVDATCEEPGYDLWYKCEKCGTTNAQNRIEPTGHNFVADLDEDGNPIVVEPTCTEIGYIKAHCDHTWYDKDGKLVHCNAVSKLEEKQPTGHHWVVDPNYNKAPTCIAEGLSGAMWVCDNVDPNTGIPCDAVDQQRELPEGYTAAKVLEKLNHTTHIHNAHIWYAHKRDLIDNLQDSIDEVLIPAYADAKLTTVALKKGTYTFDAQDYILVNGKRIAIAIKDDAGNLIEFPREVEEDGVMDGFTSVHSQYGKVDFTYKPRTCTEDGYFTWKCEACGAHEENIVMKATGHVLGRVEDDNAAELGCMETGEIKYECKVPGCVHDEIKTVVGRGYHNFNKAIAANVTYWQKKATDNAEREYELWNGVDPYDPDKHIAECYDYRMRVLCDNPLCYEHNHRTWQYYDIAGNAKHGYSNPYNVITPATCTEPGEVDFYCEYCGFAHTAPTLPLGHKGVWKVTKEATCEDEGVRELICSVCNVSYQKERIPALGHNKIVTKDKGYTCTEDGEKVEECTRCGKTWTTVTPHHHTYDLTNPSTYNTRTYKAPTCEADGFIHFDCVVCHALDQEMVIPKLGHIRDRANFNPKAYTPEKIAYDGTWWDSYTAATCLKPAFYSYYCPECKKTITASVGEVGEHASYARDKDDLYKGYVILEWPTCTAPGKGEYECAVCHQKVTQTIAQLPHNYVTVYDKTAKKYKSFCDDLVIDRYDGSEAHIIQGPDGEVYNDYKEILKHLVGKDATFDDANAAVYFKLTHTLTGANKDTTDADCVVTGIGCGATRELKVVPPEYTVTKATTEIGRAAAKLTLKDESLPLVQAWVQVTWMIETPEGDDISITNVFDVNWDATGPESGLAKIGTVDTRGGKLKKVTVIVVDRENVESVNPSEVYPRYGAGSWT